MANTSTPRSGWGKLTTSVRNAFSRSLNEKLVGETITGPLFTIRQGDSIAYALATDDANEAYYSKEGAAVSPLFASRIIKDVLEGVILHPKLGMNVLKMVHADQSFEFHRPLRVGMELVPSARIGPIKTVSSGQILPIQLQLSDGDKPVVQGVSSMFLRGPSSGGKPGGKKGQDEAEEAPLEALTTFAIEPDQPRRYAQASHDYNPLHTNKLVARLAGFKSPIAHGLCVLAVTIARLTDHYADKDPTRVKALQVRFAKPAYPDQELTLVTRGEAPFVEFELHTRKGRKVLSHGRFELLP